jgi:SAM-dependent MidA family methyltransferase
VAGFSDMDSPLVQYLRSRIQREGPISFRDFMEEALYHPELGYYTSSRNPLGREGDFYTSSDLDPVFGKLLAAKFQQMAATLDVPEESFTILELGAGRGLLARQILSNTRFRYCILERSGAMRERQREALNGLAAEWVEAMPEGLTGCVFSNEFFDALPVHRVVRRNGDLREIYVTEDFNEIERELQAPLDVPIAEGQLADICTEARRWVGWIAASLHRGYHLAIDYGYPEREFYARPRGTLMCYWKHQAVENPYVRIGEQDITSHVNFSDLMKAGEAAGMENMSLQTQMDFLIQQGILQEIEALVPATNADSVQRMMAIKKLLLPDAMGHRFKVLIQRKIGV